MKDAAYTQDDDLIGVEAKPDKPNHPLDKDDVQARFRRVRMWRDQAADLQRDNRYTQMRDHDFYDGDQWTEDDAQELRERGQAPLVFNIIKSTVDWIIGTERRTRVDYRVLPREANDTEGAETKTNLLKFVSDVNRFPYARSRAFADAIKAGVGWLEISIRSDPTEEPIYQGYEDWRNVWYDPMSVEPDMSDARFLFRERYVDLDVALEMFPDRQDVLRAAAVTSAQFGTDSMLLDDVDAERDIYDQGVGIFQDCRSRVKLSECWYRQIWRGKILRGDELGTLNGAVYDPKSEHHNAMVEAGHASIYDAVRLQTRCMIYCEAGVLQDSPSPHKHNRFPLVPIWGFRKKRANAPYGVIRGLVDPQSDLNKRRSKALFILSTQQIIADEDAVEDWDELAYEAARPDGIIRKRTGKELEIRNTAQLAEEHVMLMQQDREFIESTGGVTDEMMGRESNAQSGKAILARQDQGHAVTAELFDNLRMAIQIVGEITLSLIEQYYAERKVVRIVGDRGQAQYVTINEPQPDGSILNDITARQADFQVDAMNFSASARQAAFESMMNMIGQLGNPDAAMALLDLAIDLSDIPGKDEMVKRIRAMTGQKDPDQTDESPEDMDAEQAEQTRAQQEAELQAALQQLEIAERQAKVAKANAEAKAKEAGIIIDQEKVRIQKAEALHKVQQPPKMNLPPRQKPTDPNAQAQGNRPMVQPYRYEETRR
jgi:hypothetical protein